MNAWLLLAVFAAFYVLLMVAGVAFYLGERREARRAAELVRFPWDDEAGT